MSDIYQGRYTAHQGKKREQLLRIFNDRRSQREFNKEEIADGIIEQILEDAAAMPSSCNRQAIYVKVVSERPDKDFLSGILVGGVGWVHRANKILLIFAAKEAYKAEGEIDFMPYLDAGVALTYIQLVGEAHGVGMAYVNPNIREQHKPIFTQLYGEDIYCGAIACGYYDKKAEYTAKKKSLLEL